MPADTILFYEDYERERPRRFSIAANSNYLEYLVQVWRTYQDDAFPELASKPSEIVQAFVNHGRWVWQCEDCLSAYPVDRCGVGICVVCPTDWVSIHIPDYANVIEDTLLSMPGHRLNAPVRNWRPEWPPEMLAERAKIAIEKQKSAKGTLVGLSIRATRTWLVGEILTATNMNVYVSGTDDDLAGRNGAVEFENSIEVNDSSGRYIKVPSSTSPSGAAGRIHYFAPSQHLRVFTNVWHVMAHVADITFATLTSLGQIGNTAVQLVKGDHDHSATDAGDGIKISGSGINDNAVGLQHLAGGQAGRSIGYDSSGDPAAVQLNRIFWNTQGDARPNGDRADDLLIESAVNQLIREFGVLTLTFGAMAITPTRILLSSTGGSVAIYDHFGNRQNSEEFTIVGNSKSINAATATADRIYFSDSNNDRIRVYNHNFNRVASEDFNLASADNFVGIAVSGNRLYGLHTGSNPREIRVYDLDGTRQSGEDFDVSSSVSYGGMALLGSNLYLAETTNDELEVWGIDGTRESSLDVDYTAFGIASTDFVTGVGALGQNLYLLNNTDNDILVIGDKITAMARWSGSMWEDQGV